MQLSGLSRNFEIYTLSGKQDELTMDVSQTVGDLKRKIWEIHQTFHPSQMCFTQNGRALDNGVPLDSVDPKIHLVYRLKPAPESRTIDAKGKVIAHRWRTEVKQQNAPSTFTSVVLHLNKVKA
jgi:hypothetical protein